MRRTCVSHPIDLPLPRCGEGAARCAPRLSTGTGHAAEELRPEAVLFEEAVQRCPIHPAALIAGALHLIAACAGMTIVQGEPFPPVRQRPGTTMADLIAAHRDPPLPRSRPQPRDLLGREPCDQGQPTPAPRHGRRGLHSIGILYGVAQHLEATADAQDRRGRRSMVPRHDDIAQSARVQPRQICRGRLRPRKDDEVGVTEGRRVVDESDRHVVFDQERVEVGEVRQAG